MSVDELDFGHRRRRHGRGGFNGLLAGGIILVAVIAAIFLLRGQTITERPGEEKITRVVLPPPPPPPPPPEVKPQETPPEPKPAPIEQPVTDTPPPPTPQADPAPGDSALTAREGAGPSNYGLAVGDGGGTRIGGRPGGGGDGFAAYANVAVADIRRAAQSDAALSRGRYSVRLLVAVNADGRITSVRLIDGSGDARRDAAIERRLTGLQLSQRPPQGLPAMRIELNTRSGA
ncbi:MAG: TonB C-terminal domain-containing protein [Pseudomonadota bacterium]|nr:TonB C-terminal domain-containing protein [Pseudomonadota bacterium]